MANALGNEILYVQGIDGAGRPAASTEPFTVNQLVSGGIGGSLSAYSTSTLTATSNTTLTLIPGMSVNVIAGEIYDIEIYLTGTANASGGLKVALGGTATATSLSVDTWVYNTTTVVAQGVITSLSSNLVALTGAFTTLFASGTIQVLAGGTLTLTAAQNASFATGSTFAVNSNMILTRIA